MNIFNKKSQVYKMFIFSLIVIIVIIPYTLIASKNKQKKFDKLIGESQIHILKTYEKGEKILFYIDESANLAIKNILISMIQNNQCGKKEDYLIWIDENNNLNCFPDSNAIKDQIINNFGEDFSEILSRYPIDLPKINYEYIIDDNFEVLGITNDRIYIEINTDNTIRVKSEPDLSIEDIEEEISESFIENYDEIIEFFGYYTINPSFRTNSFIDFRKIINSAKELYGKIKELNHITGKNVINLLRSDERYNSWFLNSCEDDKSDYIQNNLVKICVKTSQYHYFYNPSLFGDDIKRIPIEIKFAFQLET